MNRKPEKRGLGRGLSALMAEIDQTKDRQDVVEKPAATGSLRQVPIERLYPNPDQPRRVFDREKLLELAESIRTQGILQPLIVRPKRDEGGSFEIVAGERRWRASQLAELHELPVIIRDYDDDTLLQVAIIENIQRSDLSPVEEARAYRQLIDQFGHTQEKVAEALGKSRSHIANLLRLLTLPDDVIDMISDGRLSAGHARALVTTENPSELAQQILAKGLTVREAEDLARSDKGASGRRSNTEGRTRKRLEKDADTLALEQDLTATLRMAVTIDHEANSEKGELRIRYSSLDDLDMLCRALSGVS
jgi:ParB family transcriptional regulator, chromosome partitioning protein